CIVDIQRDFLDRGVKYLKPLNLRKVAEIVGVHESTISRATSNKYIQTPQGVFELKYFFSSGVESVASEEGLSSRSIKKTLKDMINDEDPKNPLSDQQICEILNNRGIQISRRTVAKYRGELGIASTSTRKRY
ncbi:MAG: RNA polymerase sigma-54 factor, partial [Candidatus Saccharibacteria bacterium]